MKIFLLDLVKLGYLDVKAAPSRYPDNKKATLNYYTLTQQGKDFLNSNFINLEAI